MLKHPFEIDRIFIGWIDGIRVVALAWRDVNSDDDWAQMWTKVFVPDFSIMEFDKDLHERLQAWESFVASEYWRPLYGTNFVQLATQFLPKGAIPDLKTGPNTGVIPSWEGVL